MVRANLYKLKILFPTALHVEFVTMITVKPVIKNLKIMKENILLKIIFLKLAQD